MNGKWLVICVNIVAGQCYPSWIITWLIWQCLRRPRYAIIFRCANSCYAANRFDQCDNEMKAISNSNNASSDDIYNGYIMVHKSEVLSQVLHRLVSKYKPPVADSTMIISEPLKRLLMVWHPLGSRAAMHILVSDASTLLVEISKLDRYS